MSSLDTRQKKKAMKKHRRKKELEQQRNLFATEARKLEMTEEKVQSILGRKIHPAGLFKVLSAYRRMLKGNPYDPKGDGKEARKYLDRKRQLDLDLQRLEITGIILPPLVE